MRTPSSAHTDIVNAAPRERYIVGVLRRLCNFRVPCLLFAACSWKLISTCALGHFCRIEECSRRPARLWLAGCQGAVLQVANLRLLFGACRVLPPSKAPLESEQKLLLVSARPFFLPWALMCVHRNQGLPREQFVFPMALHRVTATSLVCSR